MSETKTLGEIAYEAYRLKTGGKSTITGLGIPHWASMSDETKAAWEAAGNAVHEIVKFRGVSVR